MLNWRKLTEEKTENANTAADAEWSIFYHTFQYQKDSLINNSVTDQ